MSLAGRNAQNLAARLKQRVRIEAPVRIDDSAGGAQQQWQEVAQVWAEFTTRTTGNEVAFAGKLQAEGRAVLIMRYRADITTRMRVCYGDKYHAIIRLENMDEANILLRLQLEEGVAL